MFNKKLLSSIDLGKYKKKNPYKNDIILDPMGQWKHPGKNTRIPSSSITMKGVNYPVLGVSNTGQKQMMQPGQEYNFPGADYVDEYPQMKKGGAKKKYTSDIINSTNYLFAEHPLFKKKKQSKKRIYDPKAKYYQDGGELPEDYQNFLNYSETAPENRRPSENYVYGSPNEYDHYGMWEALGKPKTFDEALQMNPDWQQDEEGYYHGYSVNPYTGVFLKSGAPGLEEGDTKWMEIAGHYLSPRSNKSTPVFDTDLQRFKYIPKEKNGGQLSKAKYGHSIGNLIRKQKGGEQIPDWVKNDPFFKKTDPNKDNTYENVFEIFDLSGLSSWDDAEKAYGEWKNSKNTHPTFNQSLSMFGAVPGLGKLGKIKYLKNIGPFSKAAFGVIPWQKILNAVDTGQDIETDNISPLIKKTKKAVIKPEVTVRPKKQNGGQLPRAQFGLTGMGKYPALTATPFDFRTAYGQSSDYNRNPNYSLTYTVPRLFKKADLAGNPLSFTLGRPYNTDAQSLTNRTLNFVPQEGLYSSYYDPATQGGSNPQYQQYLQDVSDTTGTPVSELNQTVINQYNAAKNLAGAKPLYKKGIPLTANIGWDAYGTAFGDSTSGPFTGYGSLNAGYAPEPGFYGTADFGMMGVFGKRKNNASIKPQKYFDKGLIKQGDRAFIPKLNILNFAYRQRPEYNESQTQQILDAYAKDIEQGTTTAKDFITDKTDEKRFDISFLSPEATFQIKPFKNIPGVASITGGVRLDYGGRETSGDNIPITPKPYGNVRYTVPLDIELPKNKIAHLFDKGVVDRDGHIRIPKRTYSDYAYNQDYDDEYTEEYTGDTPEEDTPTENNIEVNPPELQVNPNGTVLGKGDCPEGYERPCPKCRCQKIKMPQMYTDKRGTHLFGNEPIRFEDGGAIELELTDDQIEEYRKGGYVVEDISVPSLTRMQPGGLIKSLKPVIKGVTESVKNIDKIKQTSKIGKDISAIGKEILGEVLQGSSNRKAIASGNSWLNNWISNPITQAKIEEDILGAPLNSDVSPNYFSAYSTPVYGDRAITDYDKYIYALDLAKDFKPGVTEYPISTQITDFIEGLSTGNEHAHLNAQGFSTMHQEDPFQRELYKSAYYKPNSTVIDRDYKPYRNYGSFVSRDPFISPYSRESISIHEGTHDWITDWLLRKTGQFNLIQSQLDPDYLDLYNKWKNKDKTLTKLEKNKGYYADPTEVHARIMQLRRHNNLTPFNLITDENSGYFMDQLLKNNVPFNGPLFAEMLGNDRNKLAKLMNDLYGIALPVGVATGAGALLANPYADESPIGKYQGGGFKVAKELLKKGNKIENLTSGLRSNIHKLNPLELKVGDFDIDKVNDMFRIPTQGTNSLTLPGSPNARTFISEIDWSKWNPETPNYPELITEYNGIEELTKKTGTWMKNPDGSPYRGTPEQFIQEQSSHFRKAYPEGYNEVFRGVTDLNSFKDFTLSKNPYLIGDKAIFTADKNLATSYAFNSGNVKPMLNPFISDNTGGVYDLIYPKGKQITYNTGASDWLDINLSKNSTKENLQFQIDNAKKHYERLKNLTKDANMYEDVEKDILDGQKQIIENLQSLYDNFDNVIHDKEAFAEMRKVLGDVTSTDDIAQYLPKTDLRSVTLQNIMDGGLGDVTIVNNRPGNYLKSRVGNVGFFNMNNPNIYKGLVPLAVGAGAGALMANPYQDQSPIGEYKNGGQYGLGDEVDEATMKQLKKLGFTFEKIK